MIDTVSITMPETEFEILDHNRFSPNTENLFKPPYIKVTGKSAFKSVNNPTIDDKRKFGYLPRLTLIKALRRGGFVVFLTIEFSVQKILYGNNFDEVIESDFGDICWKIKKACKNMGVEIVDVKSISNANVSSIHYSKNIILTDYSTPYQYLEDFRKMNISKALDLNQTDYRNEGHALKYRSNSYEVTLYDKLEDLRQARKSEKRSVEKDNYSQLNMFRNRKSKKPFEVLRLEVRINSRKKLKEILVKHGYETEQMNFCTLFNKELAQKILLSSIENMEAKFPMIPKGPVTDLEELVTELQLNNPRLQTSLILKLATSIQLIDKLGVRGFRNTMKTMSDSQWYRLNKEMKCLQFDNKLKPFQVIQDSINNFEQVKLADYEEYIYNTTVK